MNDIKIENGDMIIKPNGYPETVSGLSEVVQRISLSAKYEKGSFAYDRSLGLFRETPDFNSRNIVSTIESLINESLVNTDVYVYVEDIIKSGDEYRAAITVTDGIREKEAEVKIYG